MSAAENSDEAVAQAERFAASSPETPRAHDPSNEPLDFNARYVAGEVAPGSMQVIADQMSDSMGGMMQMLLFVAVVIYFVLMYLLAKTVINRGAGGGDIDIAWRRGLREGPSFLFGGLCGRMRMRRVSVRGR